MKRYKSVMKSKADWIQNVIVMVYLIINYCRYFYSDKK